MGDSDVNAGTVDSPMGVGGDAPSEPTSAEPEVMQAADETQAEPEWAPPSREEYEALKKHAEVGREFSPYAEQIRGLIRQGFTPAQARQAVSAEAKKPAPEADEEDETFLVPDKYAEWWDKVGADPRLFVKAIGGIADRKVKAALARLEEIEKRFGGIEPIVHSLNGFATLANKRFMRDPDFAKIEKDAIDLVNSGKIGDFDTAVEFVKQRFAAKAGAAAAKTPATALRPGLKVPPKPNPSLNPSITPKGRGRAGDEPFKREPGESITKAAFRAARKEVMG